MSNVKIHPAGCACTEPDCHPKICGNCGTEIVAWGSVPIWLDETMSEVCDPVSLTVHFPTQFPARSLAEIADEYDPATVAALAEIPWRF